MINMKYFGCVIMTSMLMFTYQCNTPYTKDSYINKYTIFMDSVQTEYLKYSEEEWAKKDNEFKKYDEVWYNKFNEDITWKEHIKLNSFSLRYNMYKARAFSQNWFDEYLKEDYEELKTQIKYYKDNEMQEDIDFLLKQAKEIGDEAAQIVEEIIEDLEKEINENSP